MSLKKRSNRWWVDIGHNHQRHRYPSPENTRKGAQAYEILLRQRLARGEPILGFEESTKKSLVFKEYVVEWFERYVVVNNRQSEARNKRSVLKVHLVPFFGNMKLEHITSYEIEKYKATEIKHQTSNKTINNTLGVLSKCLRVAEEWELITKVPRIKRLKVAPQKYDFLSSEECDYLLRSTDDLLHDMVLFALNTGLRFGELIAMSWSDINFKENVLTVSKAISRGYLGSTKSNKIRYIPLNREVLAMLEQRNKTDDLIFANTEGKYLPQENCRRLLHSALKKIGFRKIGWHVFRHTFASRLAEKGISMRTIQELLGHSDTNTTMRYAHLSPLVLRDAVKMLEKPIEIILRHNNGTIDKNWVNPTNYSTLKNLNSSLT